MKEAFRWLVTMLLSGLSVAVIYFLFWRVTPRESFLIGVIVTLLCEMFLVKKIYAIYYWLRIFWELKIKSGD
jgi:hypothetical protein